MRKLLLGVLLASLATPAMAVTNYGFVQIFANSNKDLLSEVSFTFDSTPVPSDPANPFGGAYGNIIWGYFNNPGYTFSNNEIGVAVDWRTVSAPTPAGSITFPAFTLFGRVNGIVPLVDGTNDFLAYVTGSGLGRYAYDYCTTSVAAPSACGETFFLSSFSDQPIPGAPEPASWAMMIMGFGAIGSAMRRHHALCPIPDDRAICGRG